MNFLAHLALSGDDTEVILGNLMGDFLKGVDTSGYPSGIHKGIQLHRRIDSYTDAHPVFGRSRRRLPPPYRRYAGVLVDVFYDHFLARDWHRYSPHEDLASFISRTYRLLSNPPAEPPPRLQRALPRMIREDWLGSYVTEAGVDLTLKRISGRVSRANPLPDGASQLAAHYNGLAMDFAEFYPDLIRHVAEVSASETAPLQEDLAS